MWTIPVYIILFPLGAIPVFPAVLILKYLGNRLGLVLSSLLTPIFYLPKAARAIALALAIPWILVRYPIDFWPKLYGFASVISFLIILIFFGRRYRSIEASILFLTANTYIVDYCFKLFGRFTRFTFFQTIIAAFIATAPSYLMMTLYPAFIIRENLYSQSKRNKHARKIDRIIRKGKDIPPYCLYLRGFAPDRYFSPPLVRWDLEGWGQRPGFLILSVAGRSRIPGTRRWHTTIILRTSWFALPRNSAAS